MQGCVAIEAQFFAKGVGSADVGVETFRKEQDKRI